MSDSVVITRIRILIVRLVSFETQLQEFDDEVQLVIDKEYKSGLAKIRKLTKPILDKQEKLIETIRDGLTLAVESGRGLGLEMKDTRRFLVELKLKEKDFRHLIDCRIEIDDLLKAIQGTSDKSRDEWIRFKAKDCCMKRSNLYRRIAKNAEGLRKEDRGWFACTESKKHVYLTKKFIRENDAT